MEWSTFESVIKTAGPLGLLAMAVWALVRERSRLMAELEKERARSEELHDRLLAKTAVYGQTLLGVTERLTRKIKSP